MNQNLTQITKIPVSKSSFAKTPETPGIYIFWANVTPIYIGKAVNLKARLTSYLGKFIAPKTKNMLNEASNLSFIKVGSELEALLLEAHLIRKYQPRYNFISKDDKHPLYIKITKESYPRILTARKIDTMTKNISFYGPFPSSKTVRSVLQFLRRIFPYSDHKIGKRPCIHSHIGLCNPCPSYIESLKDDNERSRLRKKYLENVRMIKGVLDRRLNKVVKSLTSQMEVLSKNEKFEEASIFRNKIKELEYLTQRKFYTNDYLKNPNLIEDIRKEETSSLKELISEYIYLKKFKKIECYDVAHLQGLNPTASLVTFVNGEPEKSLYKRFKIQQKKGHDDLSSMKEVAKRRIKHLKDWGRPDLVIVDGGIQQVTVFLQVFKKHHLPVVGIAKRMETLVVPYSQNKLTTVVNIRLKGSALNLVQRIRDEAHRFARVYHFLLFKKGLGLVP